MSFLKSRDAYPSLFVARFRESIVSSFLSRMTLVSNQTKLLSEFVMGTSIVG